MVVEKYIMSLQTSKKGVCNMFSGEQSHQLDAKNRIRIPSQFKLPENEDLVFCKGTTQCIYVMPKSAVDKMCEEFYNVSLFDEEAQEAFSEYMSGFYTIEPDAQGRYLLPQALREYAGINKNVITVGVFNRLEIWSEEVKKEKRKQKSFADSIKVLRSKVGK